MRRSRGPWDDHETDDDHACPSPENHDADQGDDTTVRLPGAQDACGLHQEPTKSDGVIDSVVFGF
jgi:hypothetical protein